MAQLATEADIRRYGEGLYATAAAAPPRLFDRAWWTGRLLEWAFCLPSKIKPRSKPLSKSTSGNPDCPLPGAAP